jgi:hypothetical protein
MSMFDKNNGDAPTRIFLALPTDCAIVIFLLFIKIYIYYCKSLNLGWLGPSLYV